MKRHATLAVVFCFSVLSGGAGHAASRLTLGACTDQDVPKDARCGTYEVFENRATKKGRKIPLRVVVLPALGPDRLPDPVVYFAGGPGGSSVQGAGFLGQFLAPLRQRRDFLFVDARGVGGSAPLICDELAPKSLEDFLVDYLPVSKVRACRDRLSKTADLTQYTTDNVVDDVDEVRAALGYSQVNIIGGSYGTRVGLVYLRRHPDRVRTAILDGLLPTYTHFPLSFARATQKALDGLVAECAGDEACSQAFPRLKEEIIPVLSRARWDPVRVQLTDPKTAKPYEIVLSREVVAPALRSMLYEPDLAAELPLQVHLAVQGLWKPLAETASAMLQRAVRLDGFYLSVACSEDVAFLREQDIPAAVEGTMMGDFRARRHLAACAEWPTAKLPESFLAPVVSDVPVLILAGERDPATPASDAEEAARTLRRGKYVLVPDAGHGRDGMKGSEECISALWSKTIEDGSVDRLDTSCVAKMERPAFALRLPDEPEVAVAQADLEALVGRYANDSFPPVEIDLVEGRLRLKVESETFLLIPTGTNRFRPEGLPAGYGVHFERGGQGPATVMVMERLGRPDERLVRKP